MSEHVWTENTKPDRPGIWMQRGIRDPFVVVSTEGWDSDAYCFICDLPDIKDPPKYREVTPADVGKVVEVAATDGVWWERKLVGFKTYFIAESPQRSSHEWQSARILDDGQPAKQPREWWLLKNSIGQWLTYSTEQTTVYEQVKVREVID